MSHMSFGREVASVLLKLSAILIAIILIVVGIGVFSYSLTTISDGTCTIAVMPIDGAIMPFGSGAEYGDFVTTPQDVRDFLTAVNNDSMVKGVLFEINSPGGTPVASESIAAMINNITIPTVALIGDIGASGGYMIAAGADTIIASPMSEVGSIGVTMSYLEESEKNDEDGVTYVALNSGKFKDIGSPYKPITTEERNLLQQQLDEVHNYFVDLISQYRQIDRSAIATLADGSTYTGTKALEKQLVDRLGTRDEARKVFAERLGKNESDISFCEFVEPLLY